MHTAKDNIVIERECGIDYARLDAWRNDTDLLGCIVELAKMPDRKLSDSVSLPVTSMRIEGPRDAAEELYRLYELTFMSAGG